MASKEPRIPTRFERWAWSPISAYRLGLTLSYIGIVYFGVSAFIAGIPAFTIAAPEGWTPVWAAVLVIGGAAASIGSVTGTKLFERIETLGAWGLFLTLGTYAATLLSLAYGGGDVTRAAAGAGFTALAIPVFVRLLWLMSQFGRKKATSTATEPSSAVREVAPDAI